MVAQISNNKYLQYQTTNSKLNFYKYIKLKTNQFNLRYWLISNKIDPLNKLKPGDKISVKKMENSFCFQIVPKGLSQPVIRWFTNQSKSDFFLKFFMLIDYYHKTCNYMGKTTKKYYQYFTSIYSMYQNLGEIIICICNVLLQTYSSHNNSINFINICKIKIANALNFLKIH